MKPDDMISIADVQKIILLDKLQAIDRQIAQLQEVRRQTVEQFMAKMEEKQ